MKNLLYVLCLLALLTGCKSKKTAASKKPSVPERVAKIPAERIDQTQLNLAYNLGRRVLQTCNTSKFKPFTPDEATEEVIRNTTEERLTKTCHNFRLKYGDFKDLQFIEVVRDKKNKTNIYRFKAGYEKKIANKELRVFVNEKNLISAIKSMDWKDKM